MPLDPHPVEDGNVRLDRTDWNNPAAVVLAGAELEQVRDTATEPLWRPHFASCPSPPAPRRRAEPAELPDNVVRMVPRGAARG